MKQISVSDIMTRSIIKVEPSTNLLECSKKMLRHKVKFLPIVENEKLVGLITRRDIIWAMTKKSIKDLSEIEAGSISPKRLTVLKQKTPVKGAIKKMKKTKFDKFPVTKKGELVGVLTAKDVLSFHPEVFPELEEISKIGKETAKLKKSNEREIKSGLCENCGRTDLLRDFNSLLVCEECYESL